MKRTTIISLLLLAGVSLHAQTGAPYIHDPSSVVLSDGKYFTFGTGGGGLISEDGWNWHGGAVRPGGGAAPDAIKIGDRYLVVYGTTGGGMGGGHASKIMTMWNKTLDPDSPDFAYSEPVMVYESLVDEDFNAIDPGVLLDPTTGRLWLTCGTYFGHIRQIELDPKTGLRVEGNEAIDVGRNMEASTMMYRDGWYYLLGTHGTCCDGVNSTYNIVVGRSRSVNGPFLDNVGRSMIQGGGKSVITTEDRLVGPGHFGRYVEEEGVEKMSFHWEADMDRSGRSVLGIRPLLWKDGWPVAGEAFREGTYEIQSVRSGYALELEVDFARAQSPMRGFGRGGDAQPEVALEEQKLEEVAGAWPNGVIGARNGYYMGRPWQRWSVIPVPEAGGYLGGPYYKIVIAGTERALAANDKAEVETVPAFTGAPEQLWRIDQLTDGTYRIMPKSIPGHDEPYALVALGDCSPTLAPFDFKSDNSKWDFKCYAPTAPAASIVDRTSMPALKDVYKDAFKIGVAVNSFELSGRNPAYTDLILKHFNALTPDNELKPESLHPRPDVWNFERADRYVDFAKEHGMFTMGHTLCWHNQTPEFFWNDENGNPKSHDELVETLRSYIETVCTHFKGRVDAWDVINEIVSEQGGYRDKGWVHAFGGEEYGDEIVKTVFRFAEQYAPDTELYYNEFNVWRPSKLEGVLHIVKMLKEEGIRIDGVGIQAHWGLNYPDNQYVVDAIEKISALGVKVMITEIDIDVLPLTREGQVIGQVMSDPQFQLEEFKAYLDPYRNGLPAEVEKQLADRYEELFKIFYDHRDVIDRVTFWGLQDGASWKNGYPVPGRINYPLLFRRDLSPHDAYYRVVAIPE